MPYTDRRVSGTSFFIFQTNACVRLFSPFIRETVMRVSLFVHLAVLLFLSPVFAEMDVAVVSESIVKVRVYKNNKILAEGSGLWSMRRGMC